MPTYKDKAQGRYLLSSTIQAISKTALEGGFIKFSKLDVQIQTKVAPDSVNQVRIVPRKLNVNQGCRKVDTQLDKSTG